VDTTGSKESMQKGEKLKPNLTRSCMGKQAMVYTEQGWGSMLPAQKAGPRRTRKSPEPIYSQAVKECAGRGELRAYQVVQMVRSPGGCLNGRSGIVHDPTICAVRL
jgi:hypothetical protein